MLRGLSRWQLPILTLADRGGARRLERIPDRRDGCCATNRMRLSDNLDEILRRSDAVTIMLIVAGNLVVDF